LAPDARRVLDIGCAFGYGAAALTGYGRSQRYVVGIDQDPEHLRHARAKYPWLPLVRADAGLLPIRDAAVDAVVLLDVLEHVAQPGAVLAETSRTLRPGGSLVFSVPYRGLLAGLDPLNVYPALCRRWPSWPPLEPADDSASGTHRHFAMTEARALLGPEYIAERVARTGLGLCEVLHLLLLVVFKAVLRWRTMYLSLRGLHFLLYLADDLIPAGPAAYHLTVRARVAGGR
jgi:SAM-dependent methyltransferase